MLLQPCKRPPEALERPVRAHANTVPHNPSHLHLLRTGHAQICSPRMKRGKAGLLERTWDISELYTVILEKLTTTESRHGALTRTLGRIIKLPHLQNGFPHTSV